MHSSLSSNSHDSQGSASYQISRWVDEYGDMLLRFAYARLRDTAASEDVVQETFLAAYQAFDKFRHDSSPRTWLASILRHKIVDYLRKRRGDKSELVPDVTECQPESASVDGKQLRSWGNDPAKSMEEGEFWGVLHRCVEKLPEHLSEAYLLREISQLEIQEICRIMEITPTNLSVRLYRARVGLRHCLDKNWFHREPGDSS